MRQGKPVTSSTTWSTVKLRVERTWCSPDCTIGSLFVDGGFECYTLEDVERPIKVSGETAIPKPAPESPYRIDITYSQRFKRETPYVEDVPGFDGIRIHPGNTAVDTHGCLLVGRTKGANWVGESKVAFNQLFEKIKEALDLGDTVTLEIV